MEFNTHAFLSISIILLVVSTIYLFYYTYQDIAELKETIQNLKAESNPKIQEIEGYSEKEQKDLHFEEEYSENEEENSEEENDEEEEEEFSVSRGSVFDQFMINSDHLKCLSKLQSEIQHNTPHEILEEIEEVDEPDETDEVEQVYETEEPEEVDFVLSTGAQQKCEKILKTGKNSGNICGRDSLEGTNFCKLHKNTTV